MEQTPGYTVEYAIGDHVQVRMPKTGQVHIGVVEWHNSPAKAGLTRVTYRDERGRVTTDYVAPEAIIGKAPKPEPTEGEQIMAERASGVLRGMKARRIGVGKL